MEKASRHLLVIDGVLEQAFGGMTEGCVSDVVQEGRGAHESALGRSPIRIEQSVTLGRHVVVEPAGEVHRAQYVAETAVFSAREDEPREAELMNESQPLERPAVDQSGLELVGADEAVNGVSESQHESSPRTGSRC